jgi:hypothetical protein
MGSAVLVAAGAALLGALVSLMFLPARAADESVVTAALEAEPEAAA